MGDDTRERLYWPGNPLAIDVDFCESGPTKAAAYSAMIALTGAVDLHLLRSEGGDDEPRRLFAATIMLERGLFGLYFTLDGEPANGKVFSDLHHAPVQVAGPVPSYVEGVYRWLKEPAIFLRSVVAFSSDEFVEQAVEKDPEKFQQTVEFYRAEYPWPSCAETSKFAGRLLEQIDIARLNPVEIVTGIEMEVRKLGIDMPDGQAASGGELTVPASPVRHSPDFRSVNWFGQTYAFTTNQAPVVRLLHEYWQAGTPDIGDETLLAAVDPEGPPSRLATLFRDHPAWGTMIVKGGSKGAHRLAGPAPENP